MLNTQSVLPTGIQIVGVLFSAFGGFLLGAAPPHEADARFAVGVGSFLALIALFFIKGLTLKRLPQKHRRRWMAAACITSILFVISSLTYKEMLDNLTFEYPPGSSRREHVAGTELMPNAKQFVDQHPGISNAQLLARFGGLEYKTWVWSKAALSRSSTWLTASYLMIVLCLSASIFSFTEAILANSENVKKV